MKRRKFINNAGLVTLGVYSTGLTSCKSEGGKTNDTANTAEGAAMTFELPKLPYAYDALEPYIDSRTMTIHHDKHHAGYVRKLNAAWEKAGISGKSLGEIFSSLKEDDATAGLRNNGGGHYNHSLFWKIMKPGKSEGPKGDVLDGINAVFGSFDKFKEVFAKEAATQFGSGWAWLAKGKDGKLFATSTPNQDNPLMTNLAEKTGTPILGIDVWEHAYYLNYQNKRKEYINNFMNTINWDQVAINLKNA